MSDLKGLITIVHRPSRDTGHLLMASLSSPLGGCGDILFHAFTRSTLMPSAAPRSLAVIGPRTCGGSSETFPVSVRWALDDLGSLHRLIHSVSYGT